MEPPGTPEIPSERGFWPVLLGEFQRSMEPSKSTLEKPLFSADLQSSSVPPLTGNSRDWNPRRSRRKGRLESGTISAEKTSAGKKVRMNPELENVDPLDHLAMRPNRRSPMPNPHPSPAAIRQRLHRRRRRDGSSVARIEVPAEVKDALIARGWLEREQIDDPEQLADAIEALADSWATGTLTTDSMRKLT